MRFHLPACLLPIVALALIGEASAAITVTSWNYETLTTTSSLAAGPGESTVSAFNLNGGAASLGGVNFTAASPVGAFTSGTITLTYSVPSVAWAGGASGAYAANTVLNTFEWTGSPGGMLEFSGLTFGQDYTFQFIVADSRAGGTDGRVVQIFGGTNGGASVTGTSTQLRYAYEGQEQYAVISATFTADASGKAAFIPRAFSPDGTTTVGTQVNAIHIMTVPEPSIALLSGLGVLGLLRRRRV